MGRIILLALLLLSSSCRTLDIGYMHTIDARLQQHVASFFEVCQAYMPAMLCIPNKDMKVYVGRLNAPAIGECTMYPDNKLRVVIDKNLLNERNLKLVVYHELIHCVFSAEHYEDNADIMNSDSKHEEEILTHFDFYVEKMFSRIRKEMLSKKE